jgi:hypothetical protein
MADLDGEGARQQVLMLCLKTPQLDATVIAWSFYDGSARGQDLPARSGGRAPYDSGVHALEDGWRLFQASPAIEPLVGDEHRVGFLKHEFWFERLVSAADPT